MANNSDIIKRRYNRTSVFYGLMDLMIPEALRQKVTAMARGKVLEVGVGTGANLPYYPVDCQVIGIDFSPGMLGKAKKLLTRLKLAKESQGKPDTDNIQLLEMDIQDLQFPDDSFDTIIATCVFCSVPEPIRGLEELKRVCKPGGQIILLEHVKSSQPLLGRLMDFLNPVVVRLVGANINRDTVKNLSLASLNISSVENLMANIVLLIKA